MNVFVISLKVATAHAYICALCSEIVNDSKNLVPSMLWYGGLGILFITTTPLFYWLAAKGEKREEQRNLDACLQSEKKSVDQFEDFIVFSGSPRSGKVGRRLETYLGMAKSATKPKAS